MNLTDKQLAYLGMDRAEYDDHQKADRHAWLAGVLKSIRLGGAVSEDMITLIEEWTPGHVRIFVEHGDGSRELVYEGPTCYPQGSPYYCVEPPGLVTLKVEQ